MKWWSPPKQRQRWGDSLILPSGTWGQMFFDLFYVGGCINLGTILKENDEKAFLYFYGAGLPVMMMWFDKMYYDARFTTRPGHDVCHRLWEVFQIGVVAAALSRLRSVEVLANLCEHADMFQLSCALSLNSISTILKYLEVACFVEGDPAAKVTAKRDITWRLIPSVFFILATVESGVSFFLKDDATCENNNHRPIWYFWAAWISWALTGYLGTVICTPKKRLVEVSVPMNVHFCIHRYGEWFMLMFGESIISLLIVDGNNESLSYNVAFFSGVLSVIFLAHLHYSGEPHAADRHALSRSRHSSYMYIVLVPVYSVVLISIGVSYKLFLYEFTTDNEYDKVRRQLGGNDEYNNEGEEAQYTFKQEQRQRYAANLFSASIAAALLLLDVKRLLHRGLRSIQRQARTVSPVMLVAFVFLKYSVVVFLATLSVYQYHPNVMTFSGLGAIIFQEYLYNFFFRRRVDNDENKILNKVDEDDDLTWCSATSTLYTGMLDEGSHASRGNEALAVFERHSLLVEGLVVTIDQESEKKGNIDRSNISKDDDSSEQPTLGQRQDKGFVAVDYSRMAEF